MKLPLDEKIRDFENNEMPFKGGILTLRRAITDSLSASFQDERALSSDEKVKRYKIAKKVHHAKTGTEFTVEQVAVMKELVGKNFSPLVVGTCFELIEGGEPCEAPAPGPAPVQAVAQ